MKLLIIALLLSTTPELNDLDNNFVTVYDKDGMFIYNATSTDDLESANAAVGRYIDKYYVSGIHELHHYTLKACVVKNCFKYTINLTFNHNNDSVDFLKPDRVLTYQDE